MHKQIKIKGLAAIPSNMKAYQLDYFIDMTSDAMGKTVTITAPEIDLQFTVKADEILAFFNQEETK